MIALHSDLSMMRFYESEKKLVNEFSNAVSGSQSAKSKGQRAKDNSGGQCFDVSGQFVVLCILSFALRSLLFALCSLPFAKFCAPPT